MSSSIPKSKIQNPKIRVGVIFGGRSAEHQVSLVSATSIMNALDREKYDVVQIGITPEGKWLSASDAIALLKNDATFDKSKETILLPDPTVKGLVRLNPEFPSSHIESLDVIFPVLHGMYGEDGTVQGLFELAGIPYVGAGVLGSAAGMDKVVAKQLCENAGILVTPYVWFPASAYDRTGKKIVDDIERKLKYPCFVKPSNSGSSVGISKAHNRKELLVAIDLAMEYDRKILVEKGIKNAREIEISVLGNDEPVASVPGEIFSSNEFYDYDAKYVDGKSTAVIPAKLPKSVVKKIQELAIRTFKAVDCSGMGRVDFLVTKQGNKIYLNEINTIPGFTSISMYPKLWEASGLSYSKLLDRLIELAIDRYRQRQSLKTTFKPKKEWFREE
ncbi:MAG: D-alanine--D-alanine ligase [Ignavibacteriae bacterium]|nr:D-alanine--D-alanine ligase [Ignavibacteria bacterium]MBI3363289.1 D-alanine--D-alanine ligase [Ignavibacteriota bacterium]